MPHDFPGLLRVILDQYALPLEGDHGPAHWARVFEIGERLAARSGADAEVVGLFAILHDSRRQSEYRDPRHGPRAAKFSRSLRGAMLTLDSRRFETLHDAIAGHTHERSHSDVTIQTCWDSDRLDLGRVGIRPNPFWLGTDAARDPEMIAWAHGRATAGHVPEWIESRWGISLAGQRSASER